jgi:multidrug efflux pump subunit AcrA (membrane-fusion protein)
LIGLVSFINPVGQQVSGNIKYPVRIDLDPLDQSVLLSATADVNIQIGEPRQVTTVPVRAVQIDSVGEFVNVLRANGLLERVNIVSGDLIGDQVTIQAGNLAEGDQVELVTNNELTEQMSQMPGFGGR